VPQPYPRAEGALHGSPGRSPGFHPGLASVFALRASSFALRAMEDKTEDKCAAPFSFAKATEDKSGRMGGPVGAAKVMNPFR
jgi:hypothetical protein